MRSIPFPSVSTRVTFGMLNVSRYSSRKQGLLQNRRYHGFNASVIFLSFTTLHVSCPSPSYLPTHGGSVLQRGILISTVDTNLLQSFRSLGSSVIDKIVLFRHFAVHGFDEIHQSLFLPSRLQGLCPLRVSSPICTSMKKDFHYYHVSKVS